MSKMKIVIKIIFNIFCVIFSLLSGYQDFIVVIRFLCVRLSVESDFMLFIYLLLLYFISGLRN